MMASDLSYALDPVLFARACGIEPDLWQAKLLRTRPGRLLLLASRQVGKSTIVAVLALWMALYEPGSLILMVSPSQKQSSELFRTVMNFYRMLRDVPHLIAESTLRAEWSNKSRILALPGTPGTVRGIAGADMIIIDEASRVDEELIVSIRPIIATKPKAKLIALTTPAGKRGFFWEKWTQSTDWEKMEVTALQCGRLSPEFLAEEQRELGPEKYRQEYMLEFLDDQEAVFAVGIIEAAFSSEVQPLWT
jgi:hypothetical protein